MLGGKTMKKIFLSVTIAAIAAVSLGRLSSAADDAFSSVTFNNVSVSGATNMSSKPKVTSDAGLPSATLKVKDLVVGKGPAATPDSTVTLQYVGVRYADGKQFDSSWERGGPTSFSLRKVVKGFTQGIGGKGEISPMKVGGRRIIVVPSEMGYGEEGTPDGGIPPNASIVFVVDLLAVK
jgi:FKBP-type peptidyl-prolyl cis-trans isomerase